MMFEFELGEVQVRCSSPNRTRGLVERGVRPARVDAHRRFLGSAGSIPGPAPSAEWEPCRDA